MLKGEGIAGYRQRYSVHYIHGTAGYGTLLGGGDDESDSATTSRGVGGYDEAGVEDLISNRLIGWELSDLVMGFENQGLSSLSLSPEAQALVTETKSWLEGKDWFRERGIPWRRSWLLHGIPGTGKTSLVRALGQEFDLPIYVFDIASLRNDEMRKEWLKVLRETPCLILIEDIDATFDGRDNRHEEGMTFDCLLNCLDGVERTDGLLTIITTNNIDNLDPALAGVTRDGDTTRPGRVDRVVEMGELDSAGRIKLARRILGEHYGTCGAEVVSEGHGETGAQFQERCIQRALRLYLQEESDRGQKAES